MRLVTRFGPLAFLGLACGGDPPASAGPLPAQGGSAGAAGAVAAAGGSTAGASLAGSGAATGGAGAGSGGAGTAGSGDSGWWQADFAHRLRIEVDNSSGTEALEALPILVELDAEKFSYAEAASDGHDLRFVDASGTLLNHEIEAWVPGGASIVWVRLPALPGPGSAAFFVYWGNPQAEVLPAAHAQAVWSADYVGVWHFADGGADATGQHDSLDSNATFAAGPHGQAVSFDGATQYFDLPGNTKYIAGAPAITFSGWVNHAGTQPDGKGIIIGIGTELDTGHASWSSVTFSNDGAIIGEANPDETVRGEGASGAGTFPNGEWNYFTVVIDVASKQIRNYKNGAPVGDVFQGEWAAAAFKDLASNRAAIGAEEDRGPHWFQGALDEIRLQRGARSAAWIAAQGHAVTPDWLSFSVPEARP